ncbi:hypothetical protein, partial [Treponema sp. R6D11]
MNIANVKLTIIGFGGERKINLSSNGALFTVGASGQTGIELTIGNDVTLVGRRADGNGSENNNNSVIYIGENGSVTMQDGSKVTGNATQGSLGYAVFLKGANSSFTMNGGTITGNKSLDVGTISRGGGLGV